MVADRGQSTASALPVRPVLYELLNSTDREAFMKTSCDAVLLHPETTIREFLAVVAAETATILPDAAGTKLLAFTSKASVERKETELDPNIAIGTLGRFEEMLAVIVPLLRIKTYERPQFTKRCKNRFFNELGRSEQLNVWIEFDTEIPGTVLKKVYVRECLEQIASKIKLFHMAVVTGTAGTGKSIFLLYLLYKLLKEGKAVCFVCSGVQLYFNTDGEIIDFGISIHGV